jgi:uncharacterized membrane protein YfcA
VVPLAVIGRLRQAAATRSRKKELRMHPTLVSLLATLAVITLVYLWHLWRWWQQQNRNGTPVRTGAMECAIGFITDFFDTLGIGSYATSTAALKLLRKAPDELIPGTLNVGHSLPSVAQAFIYIAIIDVEIKTLATMILAAVVGAWFGAGIVSRWPRRNIQFGMGIALAVAGLLFMMKNLNLLPSGGETLGLHGAALAVAVVINAILGALMTLGIGLYAPCMMTVSLLGMNPVAAFPIMMGSSAFLAPVGSLRFIDRGRFHPRAALGLALGGVPGVLIAAYLVKSLPLTAVRWLVMVVVLYTAVAMLRAALTADRAASGNS